MSDLFTENPAEVSLVFETYQAGNLGDTTRGVAQKRLGLENPVTVEIIPGGDFQFAIEDTGQVVFADADGFRDFPAGERTGVVLVQIGHGAVIHAKEIGSRVLIGMNATVLPGAIIGNNCIIGAGCVVGQDMKVPDNSFVVGVPG